jgi:hypothetical protein
MTGRHTVHVGAVATVCRDVQLNRLGSLMEHRGADSC